jgi:hypothetical protein
VRRLSQDGPSQDLSGAVLGLGSDPHAISVSPWGSG